MGANEGNYSIRDEIREYWSERAATFDQSVGHEIFSDAERRAWHRLLRRHLGDGNGRSVLDLACGTAVVSHLLNDLGFRVTGADWSEAMLARARAKAKSRSADIRFILRDAENTMEPRGGYDAITMRHLVWTLVDPPAAFSEWFALLKPGGRLLIVDTNPARRGLATRLGGLWGSLSGRPAAPPGNQPPAMAERHRLIRDRVYFAKAMPASALVALLTETGFTDIVIDRRMFAIHWAQARRMNMRRAIDRLTADRYVICARRPA